MGILLEKDTDIPAFKEASSAIDYIVKQSKEIKISRNKILNAVTNFIGDLTKSQPPLGYCIRTKTPIPFNTKMPYSPEAYSSWKKYNNPDFQEKYCHFSGEPSYGATTYNKPILSKNWKEASQVHSL
ncbi:MAG: hypothetical protein EBX41_05515 [Chitinophagia bacterium]|nr:hypothetical protein [Chitinophagia bacterium]